MTTLSLSKVPQMAMGFLHQLLPFRTQQLFADHETGARAPRVPECRAAFG